MSQKMTKLPLSLLLVVGFLVVVGCNERKQVLKAPVVDMDPEWIELADLPQDDVALPGPPHSPPVPEQPLPPPEGPVPPEALPKPKDLDPPLDPTVGEAQQAGSASVTTAADPLLEMQWNMKKIGASEIWERNAGSRAVTVMLIGTGINYNHPDLKSNIAINRVEYDTRNPLTGKSLNGVDDDGNELVDDFVGWDFVDEDGFAYDHFGFDTYAAGIIGAVHDNRLGVRGIASQVSLYPVRYINANGMSEFPLLLQALQLVLKVNPHVVLLNLLNLEIGRQDPDGDIALADVEAGLIAQVMTEISKRGIPVIVGAGNISLEVTSEMNLLHRLAEYDNVFIVSSSTKSDEKAFLANYSNRFVQTFAPGEKIMSTAPNGRWGIVSGTYFAAAHVAGALALAISTYGRNKSYAEYYDVLRSSVGSKEVSSLSLYSVGRNRLDVSRFLNALH